MAFVAKTTSFFELYKQKARANRVREGSYLAAQWYRNRVRQLSGTDAATKAVRTIAIGRENPSIYRDSLEKIGARGRPINYIGRMLFFRYEASTKEKLPYWDRFPLIFIVDLAPNGFYGINLHYVHPHHRAILFDMLTRGMIPNPNTNPDLDEDITKDRDFSDPNELQPGGLPRGANNTKKQREEGREKLKIAYATLKQMSRLKMFKPCFKRYLHQFVIGGQMGVIHPDEWNYAMMLPTERFVQGGKGGKTVGTTINRETVWRDSARKFSK